MQFAYNGLGQRINKWNVASPSGAIHFHYDLNGQLIAETTATGTTRRDYVWLGDILVAIQTGNLGSTAQYAVHSNHLNAPQRITTSSRGSNWRGVYSPYGSLQVVTSGIGNNLRLPGQYFDTETQLHYNYFRDYDPSLGRYVQSDPIGLRGGVNTYAYVEGNPANKIDPLGLLGVAPGKSSNSTTMVQTLSKLNDLLDHPVPTNECETGCFLTSYLVCGPLVFTGAAITGFLSSPAIPPVHYACQIAFKKICNSSDLGK